MVAKLMEWTCQDCGHRVFGYTFPEPGRPQQCATCDWIRDHVPPRDQPGARQRLGVPLLSAASTGRRSA